MSLSERINAIRKEKKISIDELCVRSGVPKGTLSKITAGITTNPTLDTVQAIARALDCRLDDFDDTAPITNNAPSLSNEALQVAIDYSDLDKPGKRAVRVTLDDQRRRVKEETNIRNNSVDFIYLPWNDQPASAGIGTYYPSILTDRRQKVNEKTQRCRDRAQAGREAAQAVGRRDHNRLGPGDRKAQAEVCGVL